MSKYLYETVYEKLTGKKSPEPVREERKKSKKSRHTTRQGDWEGLEQVRRIIEELESRY